MTLAARLEAMREKSKGRVPPDKKEKMQRATEELRASGIMDDALNVGEPVPSFSLQDDQGNMVESRDLLAKGPLVLTFYRGSW